MNLNANTKQPTGRPIYWSWQAYGRFFRRDYDLLEVELNPAFFRRIISWTSGQKTALVGPENTTSQMVVKSFQEKSGTTRAISGEI